MTTVYIEDNTPEGRWLLELIRNHKSVTIEKSRKDAWQEAVDAGAVSVDAFFDELDSRINSWTEPHA